MEKTLNVAKALYEMYFEETGKYMDELKMHKLMYFSQRESLMMYGRALFRGNFYAWKYGPVLKSVRSEFYKGTHFVNVSDEVSNQTRALLAGVMKRYGTLDSWKLSSLSHREFSWKKARSEAEAAGMQEAKMSLDSMKVDAVRESLLRKSMEQ